MIACLKRSRSINHPDAQFCKSLGLTFNMDKSQFLPTQSRPFLGAILDTRLARAFVSEDRRQRLCSLATAIRSKRSISVRLKSFLGMLSSCISPSAAMLPQNETCLRGARQPMGSSLRIIQRHNQGHSQTENSFALVDSRDKYSGRLFREDAPSFTHHRCVPRGMGRTPSRSHNPRKVDRSAKDMSHQPAGDASHFSGSQGFSQCHSGSLSVDLDGQHHLHALHKQAGRNTVPLAFTSSPTNLGMGSETSNHSVGSACSGNIQHSGGLSRSTSFNHEW